MHMRQFVEQLHERAAAHNACRRGNQAPGQGSANNSNERMHSRNTQCLLLQ